MAEPRSVPPRDRRGIAHSAAAGLLALILLAGSALSGGVGAGLQGLFASALLTSAALLCIAWALVARSSAPARSLQLTPARRPLSGPGLALAAAGMLALSHLLDLCLRMSGVREASVLSRVDALLLGASGGELLLAVLALALAPALSEEILFRGVILGRLREFLGAPKGLLLSAILFGALHMDPAQGTAAAGLGVYLGALTLRTGSIHAALLCHGLNNLVAVLTASF